VRGVDIELASVAAISGGILAQELLRAVSADYKPIHSWFLYDSQQGSGSILSQ